MDGCWLAAQLSSDLQALFELPGVFFFSLVQLLDIKSKVSWIVDSLTD